MKIVKSGLMQHAILVAAVMGASSLLAPQAHAEGDRVLGEVRPIPNDTAQYAVRIPALRGSQRGLDSTYGGRQPFSRATPTCADGEIRLAGQKCRIELEQEAREAAAITPPAAAGK